MTANTDRINWFLQFQDILRIPKYPLAPSVALIHPVSYLSSDLAPDRSMHLFSLLDPAASGPTHLIPSLQGERPTLQSKPAFWQSADKRRETMTPLLMNIARGRRYANSAQANKPNAAATATHQIEYNTVSASKAALWDGSKQALASAAADTLPTVPAYSESDKVPLSPWQAAAPISLQSTTALFSAKTNAEEALRAPPPSIEAVIDPTLSARLSVRSTSEKAGTDSTAGRDQNRSLRAATVHIDGSALGQWAIQHLERTLARPAVGMTGVDPRASPPRGRVSPF